MAKKLELLDPTGPHKVGMRVPTGGSSCAKCKFYREVDGEDHCVNREWVDAPVKKGGGGGDTPLPKAANKWCCDYYER